jgi:hypothetical protein
MSADEMVCKRERDWWEHYPLHQLWCNDACPLVPRFDYRPGDEWNANNWSLHWLIFRIWTLEHFSFGADINIQPDSLSVGFILPYLRVIIGFHHMWNWRLPYEVCRLLRRKPALKNERGEYN